MKNILKYLLIFGCLTCVVSCSDDDNDDGGVVPPPSSLALAKKEMRAVWIATVYELDWPQSVYDMAGQKKKYTDYLDKFAECNVNAVFVQIRPTADAFYDSPYEPWSKSITGVSGTNPGYDVLAFMIEEAHKRDMEFHAWMNPYRIATRASESSPFPNLDAKINPTFVKTYGKIQVYNPALPEVQDKITNIVKDVITKYDVDGIHFDDYFYPSPEYYTSLDDEADYAKYGSGHSSIEEFRRVNVDKVVKKVYDVIVAEKPGVVFSISPTSNYDYNFNTLFADVTKWCQEGWIDVVIPQIYSATGSTTSSFNARVGWWPQFSYKAVPMVGYALYKFGDTSEGSQFQSTTELVEQFRLANSQQKIQGSVMYSAKYFHDNKLGIIDVLKNNIYTNPAVRPFAGRYTVPNPVIPSNITLTGNNISWTAASDLRVVIYKVENNEGKVVTITSENKFTLNEKGDYCLATVNKDNLESEVSGVIAYK